MGDDEKTPLKLDFDSKVRVEFRGATITSRRRTGWRAESLMTP